MASLFKDITPSHYIDGTYISKYSEKVLNNWAKWIYYAGLIGAILAILAGIYLLFYCFYYASQSASQPGYYIETPGSYIGLGFLCLFLSVLYALASYGAGVIISSSIRVLCNISLSLKMLNDKGVIQQPIQKQQSSGITGNTHNNSPVTCPEPVEAEETTAPAEPQEATAPTVKATEEKHEQHDVTAAFSINDRFLFLRELFDGNSQQFNDAIGVIQRMSSIDQVQQFITDVLQLDSSNDIVKEFIRLINLSFKK